MCRSTSSAVGVWTLLWLGLGGAASAGAASFTVIDALSPDQIEETTAVFVDGESVGRFHLTLAQPADALHVNVPDAPLHEYVLCGETTFRTQDQGEQTRSVNDSGALTDPDGRTYTAYTQNYVSFFLLDTTPDLGRARPFAPPQIHLGPRCPAPVSELAPRAHGSHPSTG
jgi:hypothetical protein